MCRIAIGPFDQFSKKELTRIFAYLEKSNGGDGNGIWVEGAVEKDLKMTPALAAARVKQLGKEKKGKFVFHTRLRSVGKVENSALHPLRAGQGWLVQNGTFSSWRSYYRGDATTDTMALAQLVAEQGVGVLKSSAVSDAGVFVYMDKDNQVFVLKRRKRPFVLHLFDSGRWLYASEDVGWLTTESEKYSIVEFGENVYFRVDDDGMPRAVDIEEATLKYLTTSYSSARSVYTYDDEWEERWYGKTGKFPKGGGGESTVELLNAKDFEDGAAIGIHLLSIAKGGTSDEVEEYTDLVEEWLEISQGGERYSMCQVCSFAYDGCQDHCPMFTGFLYYDEEEEKAAEAEGGSK